MTFEFNKTHSEHDFRELTVEEQEMVSGGLMLSYASRILVGAILAIIAAGIIVLPTLFGAYRRKKKPQHNSVPSPPRVRY